MSNKPEMLVLAMTSSEYQITLFPRPIQQRAAVNIGTTLSTDVQMVFLTPSQLRMGEAQYERQVFRADLPCSHFWPILGLRRG